MDPPLRLRSSAVAWLTGRACGWCVQLGLFAFLVTLVAEWPLSHGLALALVVAVVPGTGAVMWTVPRVRRCSLTVSETGLIEQRVGYRVSCHWDDVVEVQSRRWLGGLFRQEMLILRYSSTEARDYRGRLQDTLPSAIEESRADLLIGLDAFDAAWRDGPIGRALTASGLSLAW